MRVPAAVSTSGPERTRRPIAGGRVRNHGAAGWPGFAQLNGKDTGAAMPVFTGLGPFCPAEPAGARRIARFAGR